MKRGMKDEKQTPPKKRSVKGNPFGGFFDFNRDGKEGLGEQWIAHQIFEECSKSMNKGKKKKG